VIRFPPTFWVCRGSSRLPVGRSLSMPERKRPHHGHRSPTR
jgi:hypothetical protein